MVEEKVQIEVIETTKNKYGQYFTPKIIADFMIGLADINDDSKILEPSCGEGVFLKSLQKEGFENITAFEIDEELVKNLNQNFDTIICESFISAKINQKFDLIIGNPPYIRWKNLEEELKQELAKSELWNTYFNSLCDYLYIFILKSIEMYLHRFGGKWTAYFYLSRILAQYYSFFIASKLYGKKWLFPSHLSFQ